jgi:lipid II:glycine glycyltransferase (peptidoglycan interpeptide bridge formation enzyme)
MRITLLSKKSLIAGGLLMFPNKLKKTVYFSYLSLNRNLPNTYHPTYYLWWEAINWAWNNNYENISLGAQYFDENNPRYRIKNEFGAKFKPIYSKLISLKKIFTLGYKCYRYFDS